MKILFNDIENLIDKTPQKIKNYFKYLNDIDYEINDNIIRNETIAFFKENDIILYPNGFSVNNYFEFFYQLEDNSFKLENNNICIKSEKNFKFIFERPSLIGQILLKLKNAFIYSDNLLANIYAIKFENKGESVIIENIERIINSSVSELGCYINKEIVFRETENFECDFDREDQFEYDENIINALNDKNIEFTYIDDKVLLDLLNSMYRIDRRKRFLAYFKILEHFVNNKKIKIEKGESKFTAYFCKKDETYKKQIMSNLLNESAYNEMVEYIRVLRNFIIHSDKNSKRKYSEVKKFKLIDVIVFLEKLIEKEGNISLFV